jgi:hypothetical protein
VVSKKLSELQYEDLFQDDDVDDDDDDKYRNDSKDSDDDMFNIEDVIKIIKDEKEQNNRNMKLKEDQIRRDTMKRRKDREYESYWKRNEVAVKNDMQRMSTQAMYKAYYSLDVNETLSSKLQSIDNNNNDGVYGSSRVGKSIRKSSIKSSTKKTAGGHDVNKVFHTSRGTSIGTSGSIRKWQDNINDKTSIIPIKTKNILSVPLDDDDDNDRDNTQSRFQVMIDRESPISKSSSTNTGILSVTSKYYIIIIIIMFNHNSVNYYQISLL